MSHPGHVEGVIGSRPIQSLIDNEVMGVVVVAAAAVVK